MVLIGVDAQPDGTVGRRRFWRGSFLFEPSGDKTGAGFKAFRPLRVDRRSGAAEPLSNAALARSRQFARYSREQARGSKDDFYERLEALINPRPLDPRLRLESLVEALHEAVRRRVTSVQNGVAYMESHGWATVAMPRGAAIFQTAGPWEDFSTPSRDMRLLISIDTVLAFPDSVARRPARFGLSPAEAPAARAALRERLWAELARRTITYTRSDGSEQSLTLGDVVGRSSGFEMAYNPNDCVELRWAAPEGSTERQSCAHHAPAAQLRRMERLRAWFHSRSRPPR